MRGLAKMIKNKHYAAVATPATFNIENEPRVLQQAIE
jgi:hypothetical protein